MLSSVELGGVTKENVLKLTIDLSTSADWSFVDLTLPKAHTGTFTIEFYMETFPDAGQVGMKDASNSLITHDWQKTGVWTKKAFIAKASDTVYSSIGIGMVNHAKTGVSFTIYIDCVWNGDTTAA